MAHPNTPEPGEPTAGTYERSDVPQAPPADYEDAGFVPYTRRRAELDDARARGVLDRGGIAVLGALALGGVLGAYAGSRALAERRERLEARPADDAPLIAARHQAGEDAVVGRTVTIARPRAEVFAFWRDFSNLPAVMENVRRITPIGEDENDWVVEGPMGRAVHLRTRTVGVVEGERIGWRSLEGSDVETHGEVTFRDAPQRGEGGDRGTEVSLTIAYDPPGGAAGRVIAKAFQAEPRLQARRDLKRLKMLLETGEVSTAQNRKDPDRKDRDRKPHEEDR